MKEDISHDKKKNISLSENKRHHNFTCQILQKSFEKVAYRNSYSHEPHNTGKAFMAFLT